MASQCFTGPGVIRLLNTTSSMQIRNTTTGTVVGSLSGKKFNGHPCCESRTGEIIIGNGEHCVEYPDSWGMPGCNCPAVPELDFVSDNPVPVDPPPGGSCDDPAHVEICNLDEMALGIEVGLAPLGCVKDADGNTTGKVFLCKLVDEETGVVSWETYLVSTAGGAPTVYAGPWSDCVNDEQEEICDTKCYLSGGELRKAKQLVKKDSAGNYTGDVRYLDSITFAVVDESLIFECDEVQVIEQKFCLE